MRQSLQGRIHDCPKNALNAPPLAKSLRHPGCRRAGGSGTDNMWMARMMADEPVTPKAPDYPPSARPRLRQAPIRPVLPLRKSAHRRAGLCAIKSWCSMPLSPRAPSRTTAIAMAGAFAPFSRFVQVILTIFMSSMPDIRPFIIFSIFFLKPRFLLNIPDHLLHLLELREELAHLLFGARAPRAILAMRGGLFLSRAASSSRTCSWNFPHGFEPELLLALLHHLPWARPRPRAWRTRCQGARASSRL